GGTPRTRRGARGDRAPRPARPRRWRRARRSLGIARARSSKGLKPVPQFLHPELHSRFHRAEGLVQSLADLRLRKSLEVRKLECDALGLGQFGERVAHGNSFLRQDGVVRSRRLIYVTRLNRDFPPRIVFTVGAALARAQLVDPLAARDRDQPGHTAAAPGA